MAVSGILHFHLYFHVRMCYTPFYSPRFWLASSETPERHRDRLFDTSTRRLLWGGHSVKVEPLRVNQFKRRVSPL